MIEDISCSCYCDDHCKHEFALLLELQNMVKMLPGEFGKEYNNSKYMAVIDKEVVWHMSIRGASKGSIFFRSETEPIIVN